MSIALLAADYPPGHRSGIGVAVRAQAQALAARGVAVDVLVADDRDATAATPCGVGRPRVHPLDRRAFPFDPRRIEWLHLHSLSLAGLALALRDRYRLPLATTVHSLVHRELPAGRLRTQWSALQRRVLAASDRVVFPSRAALAEATAWAPEIAGRSVVVANAVPLPRHRSRESERREVVVFAGRLVRSKGLRLLERLVPRVLAERPVRFEVAGRPGDAVGEAVAARLAADHPDSCAFPGWLDRGDLERLVASARLVVVPSLYEPFGLAAAEAMAAGTPVLAADVGGLREVVADGAGGVRLDSRDPDVWAAEALALLADRRRWTELSRRGRAFVRRHFSAARTAERLLAEVYTR